MSALSKRIRPWLQDLLMRQLNDLRPPALALAEGNVLEVGFGTGLNLPYYPPAVRSVTALDPIEGPGNRT